MASTNKTPKLGLNQWAAGDSVLREDFNADNAKLAEAVGALQAHKVVFGTYKGTPPTDGAHKAVEVGFKPNAVLILGNVDEIGRHGALVIRGHDLYRGKNPVLILTETGFEVFSRCSVDTVYAPVLLSADVYAYVAFC